jgi:hypothetical protein
MIYAIYNLQTGEILQTHEEVDDSGQSKELSEAQVLSMLSSDVDKNTVGVAALTDFKPMVRTNFRIDPQTRQLVSQS